MNFGILTSRSLDATAAPSCSGNSPALVEVAASEALNGLTRSLLRLWFDRPRTAGPDDVLGIADDGATFCHVESGEEVGDAVSSRRQIRVEQRFHRLGRIALGRAPIRLPLRRVGQRLTWS